MARALSVRGYRPGVASATIFDVAAAAPHLLLPLVAARERMREAVEDALGLTLGLLVEFTGLISWRPGSHIGFHADNCQVLERCQWQRALICMCASPTFVLCSCSHT